MILLPFSSEPSSEKRKRKLNELFGDSIGLAYHPQSEWCIAIGRRGNIETISEQMARRRRTWLGRVLRMDHHSDLRIALAWVTYRNAREHEDDHARRGEGQSKESLGNGDWEAGLKQPQLQRIEQPRNREGAGENREPDDNDDVAIGILRRSTGLLHCGG